MCQDGCYLYKLGNQYSTEATLEKRGEGHYEDEEGPGELKGRGTDSLQKETPGRTPGGICSPSPGCTFCASSSSSLSEHLLSLFYCPHRGLWPPSKVPEYCPVIIISSHPTPPSGWSSALALKSWERDSTGLTQVRSPLGPGHPQPAGSLQVAPADSLPAPVCLSPVLGGLHRSSSLTLASA